MEMVCLLHVLVWLRATYYIFQSIWMMPVPYGYLFSKGQDFAIYENVNTMTKAQNLMQTLEIKACKIFILWVSTKFWTSKLNMLTLIIQTFQLS